MGLIQPAVKQAGLTLEHGWHVSVWVDTEKRLHLVIGVETGDIVAIGSEDGTGVDGMPYGECFTTDAIEEEHAAIYNRVWKEGVRGDTK